MGLAAELLTPWRRLRQRNQAVSTAARAGAVARGTLLVADPDQVTLVLCRLCEAHALLTLGIQGVREVYTTTLLEVCAEHRWLVIDEPVPRDGHRHLQPGRALHLQGRLEGLQVAFDTTLERVAEGPPPYYRVAMPTSVVYQQRRQDHRVAVPLAWHATAQLLTPERALIAGELRDLSASGMRILLNPGGPRLPRLGEVLPRCVVTLPGEAPVCCRLEVCHVEPPRGPVRASLGGRFLDLSRAEQQRLARIAAALERERQQRLRRPALVLP